MRNAFAQEITALGQADPRVVLLSGDIGNRLFDEFKARCPGRFYNCGVAEANMMGVAAGLALSGLRPVCYTITPFITYRCLEQIRVDVCYHRAPVMIVGTGSGLSYASLGATHHSCEDMGVLRLMPGLCIVAPADAAELRAGLRAALRHPTAVYFRIGKKGEPAVHSVDPDFQLGRAIQLRQGDEVVVLATGVMVATALAVAERLAAANVRAAVHSVHTVKPLDLTLVADAFARCRLVVTLEEHSVIGGLGGAVAEWAASQPSPRAPLLRLGTADEFLHETGDRLEALTHFGLTEDAITMRIQQALAVVRP